MEIKEFVTKLTNRVIDGEFLLSTKIQDVEDYIAKSTAIREEHITKRNAIIESNKSVEEKFVNFLLEDLKLDQWKVFKSKKRGRGWYAPTVRGDMYAHYKKVVEDLKMYVPNLPSRVDRFGDYSAEYTLSYENVNLKVRFNNSHTLKDIFDKSVLEIRRYEESKARSNLHLTKAKEFLDKRNEDYSGLITAKDIIELAEEMAKEAYREDRKGDIIEVQHSDGDDCEWDISYGNRCECGHNRYYLEIEGNLVDGYYSYGQWC